MKHKKITEDVALVIEWLKNMFIGSHEIQKMNTIFNFTLMLHKK